MNEWNAKQRCGKSCNSVSKLTTGQGNHQQRAKLKKKNHPRKCKSIRLSNIYSTLGHAACVCFFSMGGGVVGNPCMGLALAGGQ